VSVAGADPLFDQTTMGPFTPGFSVTVTMLPEAEQVTRPLTFGSLLNQLTKNWAISEASVNPL
jgi:hypothetical protein